MSAPDLRSVPGGSRPRAQVLELRLLRHKLRHERCGHWHILIHPDLPEVRCQDCGAALDAFSVLRRYARHDSAVQEIAQLLDTRGVPRYVTCDHCGQRTRTVHLRH